MIQFCPNCGHKLEYKGFTADGEGIYKCLNCRKKWVIKEEKEDV